MKKVLVAGAALMLVSGFAATASAADVKPGVVITGDFRARFGYQSDEFMNAGQFGNNPDRSSQTNFDSRLRVNITGTAAGGTYAKARIRFEGNTGDIDADPGAIEPTGNSNLWADMAYVGIPFSDMFTVELGRYRSTYGPLPATNNFFYDDVSLHGARGIIKIGDVEVNPFFEWMEEAQSTTLDATNNSADQRHDNDEMRMGVHAKAKINKDWTVGGMVGYQIDNRTQRNTVLQNTTFDPNEGLFASVYTAGKAGAFGVTAEFAYTQAELNNFNSWEVDQSAGDLATPASSPNDRIGSKDNGFGGYVFPTFTIDKLTLGVNMGFTEGGFQPDRAFGFVMIGTADNSRISTVRIGDAGDWLWGGLVASYAINDALKVTGNLVFADINAWTTKGPNGDGPNTVAGNPSGNSALGLLGGDATMWELSGVLQYTISKGTDLFVSAGYLKPDFDNALLKEDAAFGALTRLEIKF